MKFNLRNPFCIFGLVLLWRVLLLVFTAQPIPVSDAYGYDGAVVNYLHGGRYVNPCMAEVFPISGREIYATYPPLYQVALLAWMKLFGTSVLSAMALHLALFAVSGGLVLAIIKRFFPAATHYALAALLFFGFTFGDRPEDLAHIFGLISLGLVARQLTVERVHLGTGIAITVNLWLTLYTSTIVGAFYFGAGFLACAATWWHRRQLHLFVPFVATTILFAAVTAAIVKFEPLWWLGFMESARQQSVMTQGLHLPQPAELIKLIRTAPIFLLALPVLPLVFARRNQIPVGERTWLWLTTGIFLMGWILLIANMTLLAPSYVNYVMFTQIILAAGLFALGEKLFPEKIRWLRLLVVGCVLLVSVRAIGITTWGTACAWKNSYAQTQATLQVELEPFAKTNHLVLVSCAYLYQAAALDVKNALHCDWYFDHTTWTNQAQINALIRLQPAKLVLTQFDYYRAFVPVLAELRQRPDLVTIHVRDQAGIKPPDAIPALQRVVQHISWAPVIVDLDWKDSRP